MKYAEAINYNQSGVSYVGTVLINVEGILNPIILNNIIINFGISQNYSSFTTIAVMSVDLAPSGIITIEVSPQQAEALIGITKVNVYSGVSIGVEY